MKKLILSLIFVVYSYAAVITGSQGKVSISGASMNVTSGGVTVSVGSGEITFTEENSAPSKPRALRPNDLKDINDELSMVNNQKLINLNYSAVNTNMAKKIAEVLIKNGFNPANMELRPKGRLSVLYIKQIDINKIKGIYPAYYKAVNKYYKKNKKRLKRTAKIPTIKVKRKMMRKYHRRIYNKYR